MKTIKCGIIGLGWFGEKHCEALHDLPQAQIHAVCTRRPDRLKEVVDRFDIPASYTNYHDMLADPEIDVVSVVTMWDQHVVEYFEYRSYSKMQNYSYSSSK